METTTRGFEFRRRVVTVCGIATCALTLGLGVADASDRPAYQPGDAAGHAASDLQAANDRQAAAVARATEARWSGDAAGHGESDRRAAIERQAVAVARNADGDTVAFGQFGLAGVLERLERQR